MKKNAQLFCILLTMSVLLLTFSSCKPKTPENVKAEAAGNNAILKDDKKTVRDGTRTEKEPEISVLSVVGEPEGKDFLLFHETAVKAVFLEDFKIGPLQSMVEMDETETLLYNLAVKFSDSVVLNNPDSNLIYSIRRDFLIRNLKSMIEGLHLKDYRLGMINTGAEPARADIRFIGSKRFYEGTIYFIREDRWKIFDLQIEDPDMSEEEKIDNEKWFPVYNKVR